MFPPAAFFGVGMDVRLSQNIAFITYGVTDRFDVSVGLPMVHSAVEARTYNAEIYTGNGTTTLGSTCWCVNTWTPGTPTLILPQVGLSALGKTGFGNLLVRAKGTVLRKRNVVVGAGADVRLPTGSAENFLGVGTTTVKPFGAVSFYSKQLPGGIVVSPHFDVGWEFGGKSVLGGALEGSPVTANTSPNAITYYGAPFITPAKGYLPDVFTWAAGTEIALGRRETVVVDLLGNEVGLIHGIPNATYQTLTNQLLPTSINGGSTEQPTTGSASGFVPGGPSSFGQYYLSLGYKARVVANLVANVNLLVRLDNNGLVAKYVPLFGLGYSF